MADGGTRWKAERYIYDQNVYGGMFNVEEDAAKASDDIVLDYLKSGGKFKYKIKLNFRRRKLSKLDKQTRNRILILGEERQSTSPLSYLLQKLI